MLGQVTQSGTYDKIGTMQKKLEWPLCKDDAGKSKNNSNFYCDKSNIGNTLGISMVFIKRLRSLKIVSSNTFGWDIGLLVMVEKPTQHITLIMGTQSSRNIRRVKLELVYILARPLF